ncbi:hypothetical protein [Proteus hauseri]|uniref:hypothetical protein n=1 Tax=Proteus hauseri TaxID=183417 RepID=UPI0032DAD257
MMFALLFFNISFIAIMNYSQSLQVDFHKLIKIQQTGQAIFVLFEQASHPPPFHSVYNQQIMTQSLLHAAGCQKITGYLTRHQLPTISLYRWSCY